MKISYKWLLELTGLDWPVEKVADSLTLCGTACEDIEATARYLGKVVVGNVVELKSIEGASKIRLARVDAGGDLLDIVCGAPNVAVGQKVPVALIGAKLAGDFEIEKAKIRGVESTGMICSERELGFSDDHSGIMVLNEDAPVGRALVDYLDYDDYILTFELTPNRGDSTSAIGIARDLAALAGVKVLRPECGLTESNPPAADSIKVSIDNPQSCPRYAARIIRNVKMGQSPWWVKKKLLAAGVRPISNVVDVTNLVMLECGHPLHAFDLARFGSNEVLVRMARDKEKFITLDETEHELSPDVILITNGKEAVAAGGVMGGLNSEIEDDTKDILLEAAYFNPSMIRRSRRHLGMATESSSRFEKGADPNGIPWAIDRAAYLFQTLCDGEIASGIVDCYPNPIEPMTVPLRPERCNQVMGTDLTSERMRDVLENLGLSVADGDPLQVTVPTFRGDLEREIDLIEEVARMEGWDSIPNATENIGPLYTPVHFADVFNNEIRTILTGVGFDEIVGHGLADSRRGKILQPDQSQVGIVNPVSEDLNVMRTCLAQSALGVVEHNIAHRNLNLQLFEIGSVYAPPTDAKDWGQQEKLLLAVTGETSHTWRSRPRPFDFYDITGALEQIWGHFRLPPLILKHQGHHWFDSTVAYAIEFNGEQIGVVGQLTKEIARKFDVKQTVYLAELSLAPLTAQGRLNARFTSLPIYPAAPRDLAIVVEESVRTGDMVAAVKEAVGDLAESVSIFDLYQGKQIDKGKKSIAISISYRSQDGNLSSEEVDAKQQVAVDILKKRFNAEIRDK